MSRTVADALRAAERLGLDRLDARLLVGHVLQRSATWVIAHGEFELSLDASRRIDRLIAQRADQVPVAYLLGQREFHGLELIVSPAVLDPRADTEVLVEWSLELMHAELNARVGRKNASALRVVDLGTGCGAIAVALGHRCKTALDSGHLELWATERSPAALDVARLNRDRWVPRLRLAEGSWFSALGAAQCKHHSLDLIVSNPPYLAADDPHLGALRHEPREALVADRDGYADLLHIAEASRQWLRQGGWLVLEHGYTQGPRLAQHLTDLGYDAVQSREDLAGHTRCTAGQWPRA